MDIDGWERRQDRFLEFLKEHNADLAPYRVDLEKRKIYWVDELGLSLVVADCKVLLSYALSNKSVLMGWVNASLPEDAAIKPLEAMDELYAECEPEEVWNLTIQAATLVRAEAIYRTPSPQSWVMLGIWNLRPGGAEQFTSGSPEQHVCQVLSNLIVHLDFSERQILIDNYAESFLQMASHPYRGTSYEERLKDSARALRNLLAFPEKRQNEELVKIRDEWSATQ